MPQHPDPAPAPKIDSETIETLVTLRDWLRFGVSAFHAAGLVYGHGTATAMDEAAFLILETLHLPIDQLEPWLDARLTVPERRSLAEIITARIATRKPAPYLTRCAYIRGHRFYVDERVIVPRSYIGELLEDGLAAVMPGTGTGDDAVTRILDLCTGGGSLAILAALAFPEAHVDAVDISAAALEVATRNVGEYGLADRVMLMQSDLFAGLAGRRYDLILSNPPYVTAAAVQSFPPEFQAEPALAHLGGNDGLDLVRRILAAAAAHLTPHGQLVVEIGMGREALESSCPELPFLWLDTEVSAGEVFALPASAFTRTAEPAGKRRIAKSRRKPD